MRGLLFLAALIVSLFSGESVSVCGTGDSVQLLRELARMYEKSNPNIKVEVPESVGSGGGVKKSALGECDIGRVARRLNKNEESYNLTYTIFAHSPVVFVANVAGCGVSNIDQKDVLGIYGGEILSWEHFCKENKSKIFVLNREPGDSSRSVLNERIAGFETIKNPAGAVAFSTQEALASLIKYKNTIGYLPLSEAKNSTLRILSYNKKEYSSSEYELMVPFGFVYQSNIKASAKGFIEFVQSKEAEAIFEKYGVITAK